MFCPSCGSEERQASQFCRGCGTDLRSVRLTLERPDSVTASAVSARDEIGRAVAQRIREVPDAAELKKIVEDVLPKVEEFLESPEEKRLRRVRGGVVVAACGLGFAIFMLFMAIWSKAPDAETFMGVTGVGITAFLLGIGLIINALFFTKPRQKLEDHSADAQAQSVADTAYAPPQLLKAQTTSDLAQPRNSVTENTTLHLKSDR